MAKPIIKGNLKDSDKVSLIYNGREVSMTVGDFKTVVTPVTEYKVYIALLEQSGTSAPVPTVLKNTLGDISFNYLSTGNYEAVSSELFTAGKTTASLYVGQGGATVQSEVGTSSAIELLSINSSNVPANFLLQSETSWIEIRVYD